VFGVEIDVDENWIGMEKAGVTRRLAALQSRRLVRGGAPMAALGGRDPQSRQPGVFSPRGPRRARGLGSSTATWSTGTKPCVPLGWRACTRATRATRATACATRDAPRFGAILCESRMVM
jgi:hypothetical protein